MEEKWVETRWRQKDGAERGRKTQGENEGERGKEEEKQRDQLDRKERQRQIQIGGGLGKKRGSKGRRINQ